MVRSQALWDFLSQSGVLEHGTEEDIAQAKKEYRKIYYREYKRKRRRERKEITLMCSHKEYREIQLYAKQCKKGIPTIIRESCLATIRNEYYVPNQGMIAKLEQLLSRMYFEIQQTTPNTDQLLQKVDQLERDITDIFRHPPALTSIITEVLQQNPSYLETLTTIIHQFHHDHHHQLHQTIKISSTS